MFLESTPAPGSDGGGLANAIVGSLMLVGCCTLISAPVGVMAGIYLSEYGNKSKVASVTRFVTDIMLSAPSDCDWPLCLCIIGRTGKAFFWLGWNHRAIAVPVIVRTTENMLRLVPGSLREAAYALGAPKWKVALRLPYAQRKVA